jgi:hypothetical protein
MIPAAVRELTEAEALETHPSIQSRVICRFPNGEWYQGGGGRTTNRERAEVFENYNNTPLTMALDMIVEILPDEVRTPAANRVAPAINEMTHAEMQVLFENDDPASRADQIMRMANGRWWSGTDLLRPIYTTNRDEATVFHGHGRTSANAPLDCIIEILTDQPIPDPTPPTRRRVPVAIRERDRMEMQQEWSARGDATHDEDLHRRMIVRTPNGTWYASRRGSDQTPDREQAHIYEYFGETTYALAGEIAEILPIEDEATGYPVQPIQPVATGKLINKYFSPDFMRMFVAAPKNDMVRGWILKITKQLPAEDCETPEKLEEWLQSIQGKTETLPPPKGLEEGVSVDVSFTGSESGTCRYQCNTTGGDRFVFDADDLRTLVAEADGDFDSLLEHAREQLSDGVTDLEPDMSSDEDGNDYDRYVPSGDNANWDDFDYSNNQLKENLIRWIRNNMPEAVELLGL